MGDDTLETRGGSEPQRGEPSAVPSRQRIGQYEVRSVIASGGMGVVYEAFQQSPRRPVALKIMRLGLASASARERFEREAQLLARLHHPGIVQVFEAGTHQEGPDQVPFIAMELIAGARTITQYATAKALKPQQVVELLLQACSAVQHGNESGVIHRDLKPSNLLVDQDGNVKVIDFGVARALDNDTAEVTMQTHIGQLVGTVQYMSPEQIGGDSRALDARTDVYSLGVVLYELLSGRLPFDLQGKTLAEASRIVQADAPTRLSAISAQVDPAIETIVNKAIARERAERYSSVRDLADDLSRWIRGEEIHARAAGAVAVAFRSLQRRAAASRFVASMLMVAVATCLGWSIAHLLVNHFPPFTSVAIRLEKHTRPPAIEKFQHAKAIIINRDDETLTAQSDAAAANIAGVSNENARSWRLLQAQVMKKLARSGARALAFDIQFAGSDPQTDDAMLEGIAACEQGRLPLILFRPFWPQDADVPVAPADRILADPRIVIGVGTVPQSLGETEYVTFANKRGDHDPWPSLALAAWAGAELGRVPIEYSYDLQGLQVEAKSREPSATSMGRVIRQISFPVASIQKAKFDHSLSKTRAGDMYALCSFGVPTSQALADASISMSACLTMSDAQLRDAFKDRIVVVADAARDSKVTLRGGSVQRGYVIHMAAIEGMSKLSRPRLVDDVQEALLLVFVAGSWGLLVGSVLRKMCAPSMVWLAITLSAGLSSISTYSICYLSPEIFGLIVHPLAPGIAAVVASVCACLIFKPGGR